MIVFQHHPLSEIHLIIRYKIRVQLSLRDNDIDSATNLNNYDNDSDRIFRIYGRNDPHDSVKEEGGHADEEQQIVQHGHVLLIDVHFGDLSIASDCSSCH